MYSFYLSAEVELKKIPGDTRQASAASELVANVQKYNFAIFKPFLRFPEAPEQKRRVIFELSMKFCICGAQKLKMVFSGFAALFSREYTPLELC